MCKGAKALGDRPHAARDPAASRLRYFKRIEREPAAFAYLRRSRTPRGPSPKESFPGRILQERPVSTNLDDRAHGLDEPRRARTSTRLTEFWRQQSLSLEALPLDRERRAASFARAHGLSAHRNDRGDDDRRRAGVEDRRVCRPPVGGTCALRWTRLPSRRRPFCETCASWCEGTRHARPAPLRRPPGAQDGRRCKLFTAPRLHGSPSPDLSPTRFSRCA